jgi:hypothetical protein
MDFDPRDYDSRDEERFDRGRGGKDDRDDHDREDDPRQPNQTSAAVMRARMHGGRSATVTNGRATLTHSLRSEPGESHVQTADEMRIFDE